MLRNKNVAATGFVMASCVLVGVVLQARETKSADGPCAAAGYHSCCDDGGLCQGDSEEQCYCDIQCAEFNDCCSDIHEIGCFEESSSVVPTSTMIKHVLTTVSFPGDVTVASSAVVSPTSTMGPDTTSALFPASSAVVSTTPTLGLSTTSTLVPGPCAAAGYHSCCEAGVCDGYSNETCYCDNRCMEFDDCCSDIHEIGCYEESSSVVPTSTMMEHVPASVSLSASDVVDTEIALAPPSNFPFFIVVSTACAIGVLLVGVVVLSVGIIVCLIKKRRRQRAPSPKPSPSHVYHTITPKGKLATESLRKIEVENIYDDIKGISARKSTELTVNVSYTHMTSNTAYADAADNVTFTQSADNPTYKQVPNTYTYVTTNNVYEPIPENNAYEHIPDKNAYANVTDCPPYAHVADNVGYASVADNVAY